MHMKKYFFLQEGKGKSSKNLRKASNLVLQVIAFAFSIGSYIHINVASFAPSRPFQMLFHQPMRVMNWLVFLTCSVVGYQFFRLVQSSEWSHVISLALLMFCNFYTLFKLLRDWFLMGKVYKDHDYGVTNWWWFFFVELRVFS